MNKNGCIERANRFCTFCYEENKTVVMGDEMHAILKCSRFCDERNSLFSKIDTIVPHFKNLNEHDKLFYMLTCENECAIVIGKFLNVILSAKRSNFSKLWKQFNES